MKTKNFILFTLSIFLLGGFLFKFGQTTHSELNINAVSNLNQIRVGVVRPTWWQTSGANQYLRVSSVASNLNTSTPDATQRSNIVLFSITGYADDTYYKSGGFGEYATDGIVFYDINKTDLVGKYWDLVRYSSSDPATASIWNRVAINYTNTFAENDNHYLVRIFGDGSGAFRPSSTETRNISNVGLAGIMFGYLTCSSSTDNGYGSFNILNTNFNLDGGRTYADTDTLIDYAYGANYSNTRGTGITVKLQDKVNAMKLSFNSL
jgi:hypothetical protein